MYQQKYGKRFSVPSGGEESIVISPTPVEKTVEPVRPKSPERPPICMATTTAQVGNYERRRYNRYFSRFSQKNPTPQTTILASSPPPSPLPPPPKQGLTKEDLRDCLQEALSQWREMIPEFAAEIVNCMQNMQEEKLPSPEITKGAFVPFFNDPENTTIGSKTLIDGNGYLHLQVGLAGRILSEEILLYPFGLEILSLDVGENHLQMSFQTDQGKEGKIAGTFLQKEDGLCVIVVESCTIDIEEMTGTIDFSELDVPLQVTFEGGLI